MGKNREGTFFSCYSTLCCGNAVDFKLCKFEKSMSSSDFGQRAQGLNILKSFLSETNRQTTIIFHMKPV